MDFTAYDLVILPIIVGLVAIGTQLGMSKKYAPILALILGIGFGVFYLADGDVKKGILIGIAVGLSAVGLHSGTKNVVQEIQQ